MRRGDIYRGICLLKRLNVLFFFSMVVQLLEVWNYDDN